MPEFGESIVSAVPAESSASVLARPHCRRWPRSLAALEVANYRLYLSSQVVATTGLWMQRIAQDWLILQLTGSVTAVGITVALQFAPVLFFGLFGGVIADRYPKRLILMVTQTAATLMALALGVLALTGAVQAWQVYLIACLLGFITVVDNPTRQVFVSELVGKQHINNAVSLNSSVFQLGALLGPALSGVLIIAVGQGWSFLINAAACGTVVLTLAIIKTPGSKPPGVPKAKGQLREGLAYIRRTSEVAWTIVLVGAIGLFGLNMPVILSAFANTEFRTGVGGYSMFNSLSAIGALLGAIASARRKQHLRLRQLVTALSLLGVAFALASLAPSIWLFSIILLGIGFTTLSFTTSANSLVQTTAPEAVRGRVMSVYLLVFLGGQAIGSPVIGWLIDHAGTRPSLFLCGALIAGVSIIAGLGMARTSGLRLSASRRYGRAPLHIVSAPRSNRQVAAALS